MKRENVIKTLAWQTMLFATILCLIGVNMPRNTAFAEEPKVCLLARFCTYYGDSSENRKQNVELACRKINGLTLYPEEEFSFNSQVGERSVKNGFKTAYIISDGDFVEGVGGGVCQVSSTLYNCALLANLAITCVNPHSLPVSYVAPSFDAMVSSGSDFRFVNSLSAPIKIVIAANGNDITAEIYGVGKVQIKRRSITLEQIPFETVEKESRDVEVGQEVVDTAGKNGIKSQGYLDYFEDGKLTKSVLIRTDYYAPQKRVVLVPPQPGENSDNKN